jgi:hypothetical protein
MAHAAGAVTHIQVVRIRPRLDDVRSRLCEELPGRPDHELHQAVVIDAGWRGEQHAHEHEDGDDDAHSKAQRCDADSRERPRPDERATGVKEVGDVAEHFVMEDLP